MNLKQKSFNLVCIFESPQSVTVFNRTHTDEMALYNLN